MINDSHLHITYKPTTIFSHYTFDYFLKDKNKCIDKTVLFINPIYNSLYTCEIGHRNTVYDLEDKKNIMFKCDNCGKISYIGEDPYREDNIKLLKDCMGKKDLFPYIYLSISNNTIKNEFEFFKKNYKGLFYGIKVHPNLCSRKMSEIDFDSGYPIVVHCGVGVGDDPKDIVKFAKRYSGNVLFAHFGKFDVKALEEIAKLPNAYVDTSPLYLAEEIVKKTTDQYYPSKITDVKNITELFVNLINIVGIDKVVFGSDCPWGQQEDALKLYELLDLPKEYKDKIFTSNFERFNLIHEKIEIKNKNNNKINVKVDNEKL